jgi:hypothetical protein
MKLCTCNNCGNVYEDFNPSDDSIEYPNDIANGSSIVIKELETLKDLEMNGEPYYGCLECETDGYLVDNVNEFAGDMAEILAEHIAKKNLLNDILK